MNDTVAEVTIVQDTSMDRLERTSKVFDVAMREIYLTWFHLSRSRHGNVWGRIYSTLWLLRADVVRRIKLVKEKI